MSYVRSREKSIVGEEEINLNRSLDLFYELQLFHLSNKTDQ